MLVAKVKSATADDVSYQEITAMLTSSSFSDAQPSPHIDQTTDHDPVSTAPHASAADLPASVSPDANPTVVSAATPSASSEVDTEADTEADSPVLKLPSISHLSVLSVSNQKPAATLPESDEDLFARMTALKDSANQPTATAETLDALNDRLSALKGPKPSPADLQELHKRLDTLKGRDKEAPSLAELEGRLAKLKGSSALPKGKPSMLKGKSEWQTVPDFDPDVELNEDQLEVLANMSEHGSSNVDGQGFFIDPTSQSTNAPEQQPHIAAASSSYGAGPDVRQVLQGLESEDELTEQQLLALASMRPKAAADVPAWAAALGLSAEDLHHDSDADEQASQQQPEPKQGVQKARPLRRQRTQPSATSKHRQWSGHNQHS